MERGGRGCRKPWNKTMTKVVSDRRKFRLVAKCQVLQENGRDDVSCADDADQLIAQCQEELTGLSKLDNMRDK